MKNLDLDIIDTPTERFMYRLRFPLGGLAPIFPLTGLEILEYIYSKLSHLEHRKFSVGIGPVILTKEQMGSLILIFNEDFTVRDYYYTE